MKPLPEYIRPVLITMGDPGGIGPELIVKSFTIKPELFKILTPIVIGDLKVLKKYTGKKLQINVLDWEPSVFALPQNGKKRLYVIDLNNVRLSKLKIGEVQASSGKASIEYLNCAVSITKRYNWKIPLVTAPVSKIAIIKSGIKFQGHTEYLAKLTDTKVVTMVMVSEQYVALLLTRHIPLKDVSKELTVNYIVEQVKVTLESLKRYFNWKLLYVAVCNLNPHRGEEGEIGTEEKNIIIPAVNQLKKELDVVVSGPISADYAFKFAEFAGKKSTIIVCNYHDQAMVPLNILSRFKFVNLTCGLPFVRISPAHGTGFDIAGKNIADPTSMIEALLLASKIKKTL